VALDKSEGGVKGKNILGSTEAPLALSKSRWPTQALCRL